MSFFYNCFGDFYMKVYIDLLLFLNFAFDLLLLLTTSIVLRRKTLIINIIIGAFIGSLSILILFFNVNNIQLFLIKVYLSIIMCLVTFGYKDLKYTITNIFSFYLVSILLGGFLYLLNIEFSYDHSGLIFYHNGLSINVIFLFIIAPIILYIYVRQTRYLRNKIGNYYKVSFNIGRVNYNYMGYLDTGNTLKYKGVPVIIINKKIKSKKKKTMIPYFGIGSAGILECIFVKIYVCDLGEFDVWLGYNENFKISGAEVLLNGEMEGLYD